MKWPTEAAQVKVGQVLEFCDGTRAAIVEILKKDGELMARLDLLRSDITAPEEFQSIDSIQKWVGRGIWKLRRA